MESATSGKGKQFTIGDDKGPQEIILRSKLGVYVCSAYDNINSLKDKIYGNSTFFLQTKKSNIIFVATEHHLLVYDIKERSIIAELKFNYIYSITLSPQEKYLQVLDKINMNEGKTQLYSLPQMKLVAEYQQNQHSGYFNKQAYPLIRFTSDDNNYFRYNSKVIQVYGSSRQKIREINSGPIQFFQVSKVSKQDSYVICSVFLDKKHNSGRLDLFSNNSDEPFYQKPIKKAEQVKVKFSPTSNSFLMQLQTYFDPTGKSYYGQYGIYLYNDKVNKISTVKTEKGPVHDYSWHQTGDTFIIISGFMPATAILVSKANTIVHQFGKKHRNTICWGNLGRFVCLAGFGNLNGQMQMWDLQKFTQVGYCKSNSASFCQWSLDDRKIMTNIVTPRLRVDNCFKIFSYTGVLLNKVAFDDTQLYETHWLNIKLDQETIKPRGLSPGRRIQIQPKKEEAKFKTFASALNFGGGSLGGPINDPTKPKLAPGQHPEDAIPPKKRRKRKAKEANQLEAS